MASRSEDLALPPILRPSANSENLIGTAPARATGTLFRVVRDEPFVEPGLPAGLALPTADALALQRCMDVTVAIACLLVVWPILAIAALAVRLTSPGPIIYCHQRLGRNGRVFSCFKFRTMRQDADRALQLLLESSPEIMAEWVQERKLRNDPRITSIGTFLRRYSIDELPQLFNVLRGEMSIVGPRPIATDEAHYYAGAYQLCCSVNPGITGLWQVSGRNDVAYSRRVQLDCEYAATRSVRGDLRIIARTIPVVFGGNGH